jgi:hypothetical protein
MRSQAPDLTRETVNAVDGLDPDETRAWLER